MPENVSVIHSTCSLFKKEKEKCVREKRDIINYNKFENKVNPAGHFFLFSKLTLPFFLWAYFFFLFKTQQFKYFRLVGSIPGPVFFGAIIDQTCLLLSDNCLFYDNYRMSLYMMLVVVLVKLVNKLISPSHRKYLLEVKFTISSYRRLNLLSPLTGG